MNHLTKPARLAGGLLLALAGIPVAAQAAAPVVSTVNVAIVDSRVPIPDSSEQVTLAGSLHLVVRVVPLDDGSRYFTVYANLPASLKAESTTGERFVAVGAVRHADTHPGLIIPCIMPEGFTLIQADPAQAGRNLAPVSFALNVLLRIDETGEVLEGVASTSRDILIPPR